MTEYEEWKMALRDLNVFTDPAIKKNANALLERIWICDTGETFRKYISKARKEISEYGKK